MSDPIRAVIHLPASALMRLAQDWCALTYGINPGVVVLRCLHRIGDETDHSAEVEILPVEVESELLGRP